MCKKAWLVGLFFALCAGCDLGPRAPRAHEPAELTAAQLLAIAELLEQGSEHVRAQQYLQQALRAGAAPEEVIPRLLRVYAADGQYRLAVEQAEHYLRAHPSDRRVRLFLAALYTALGLDAKAVDTYARVLAEAPDHADAHFALASALHDGGREAARADEHFRAYLALEPQGSHAEEARSLLLTELP